MERLGKVGDLTKVISLVFLNAHFEHLALACGVDEIVANLVHTRHWEVHRVLLLKVSAPLWLLMVYRNRQVALEKFEGIAHLIRGLKIGKASRLIGNDEVFGSQRQDSLNREAGSGRVNKHEFEVSVVVAEHDLAAICAD